jgi:phosphate butyryltransferase
MKSEIEELPLLQSMEDIIHRARDISSQGEPYRVAVAAAHDEAVIDAIISAKEEGVADAILIGYAQKINELLEERGHKSSDYRIIETTSDDETAERVAETVASDKAQMILKGLISTGKLLKKVLDAKYGLRQSGLLSHTAVMSPKRYHKLLLITDGGMVIKPTFEQKVEIIRNAVLVGWALGIKIPKVAVLATIDQVVQDFPETFEAAALSKMAQRGQFRNCEIDGPISFDTAIWQPAVDYQGIDSTVAGQADIVLTGAIEEGNILAKSLVQFGDASFAGVIVGAKMPISLVSRADSAFNKMASVALAVVVSHYIKTRQ